MHAVQKTHLSVRKMRRTPVDGNVALSARRCVGNSKNKIFSFFSSTVYFKVLKCLKALVFQNQSGESGLFAVFARFPFVIRRDSRPLPLLINEDYLL